MDPQESSNHNLQVAAEHIAEACTSTHLVEDAHGQASLLVYRDKERLGTFDGGTYLYELLKGQLDLNDRQFRFRVDGMTYIGWGAIGQRVMEENNRKGLPLGDMEIEVTVKENKMYRRELPGKTFSMDGFEFGDDLTLYIHIC